ncbi:hypothetical protein PMI29_04813 [Pseudomonas sp. GM49]|uniref:hypothetical protein n=1 Tax=Pseudomonas sp. GM49 TaxID=1144331 RepID=UPI00026FDCB5|nr:hypothetical protein [Pseudomonas sp. GM49]EJM57312.1 hypothetical protein PMI29_04813 [Pseudomonas sp. GM49]
MNRHFSTKNLTSLCLASVVALSSWFRLSTAINSVAEARRRIARACAQLRGEA